jgi:hypothetical protein
MRITGQDSTFEHSRARDAKGRRRHGELLPHKKKEISESILESGNKRELEMLQIPCGDYYTLYVREAANDDEHA